MRTNFKIPREDDEIEHIVNMAMQHGNDRLKARGADEIRSFLYRVVEMAKDAGVFAPESSPNIDDDNLDELTKLFAKSDDVADVIELLGDLCEARESYEASVGKYKPTQEDIDWVTETVLGSMKQDKRCLVTTFAAYMIDKNKKQVRRIMTNPATFRTHLQVKMAAVFKAVGYEMVDTGSA